MPHDPLDDEARRQMHEAAGHAIDRAGRRRLHLPELRRIRDEHEAGVMASPKARPPALKLIEGRGNGRDSGGRKVEPTPSFRRLPPEAPAWLPDEAAAEWERVVPELARLELLKPVDRASLTAYCLTWDRLVTAQRLVTEDGVLSSNSQGVVRHPAVAVVEAASKELRAWAAEFGFTPSAENKLKVQESDDDQEDPFG
jgi:P27 family predicted phage terminase small subunit